MKTAVRKPICSIVSLMFLAVGFTAFKLIFGPSYLGPALAFFALLAMSSLGLLLSVISLLLRERFSVLGFLALVLNVMTLLWLWNIRNEPVGFGS
jgi:uncharacterized membrane protein